MNTEKYKKILSALANKIITWVDDNFGEDNAWDEKSERKRLRVQNRIHRAIDRLCHYLVIYIVLIGSGGMFSYLLVTQTKVEPLEQQVGELESVEKDLEIKNKVLLDEVAYQKEKNLHCYQSGKKRF